MHFKSTVEVKGVCPQWGAQQELAIFLKIVGVLWMQVLSLPFEKQLSGYDGIFINIILNLGGFVKLF